MYSENRLENVLFWKKLEPAGFRIFGTGPKRITVCAYPHSSTNVLADYHS